MNFKKIIITLLITLSVNIGFVYASGKYPLHMFFFNSNQKFTILIDKTDKIFYLYKIKNDFPIELLKFENILIGENKGDKLKEGDKKTPEGIYRITSFIPPNKLHSRYGAGAFTLDYPNFYDKKMKKTGYGIWIHGFDESKNKTSTKGCIALKNKQIKRILKYNPVNSFVIITKKANFADKKKYLSERNTFNNFIKKYSKSLNSKDIKNYPELITEDFIDNKNHNKQTHLKEIKNSISKNLMDNITFSDISVYMENISHGIIHLKLKTDKKSFFEKIYIDLKNSNYLISAKETLM